MPQGIPVHRFRIPLDDLSGAELNKVLFSGVAGFDLAVVQMPTCLQALATKLRDVNSVEVVPMGMTGLDLISRPDRQTDLRSWPKTIPKDVPRSSERCRGDSATNQSGSLTRACEPRTIQPFAGGEPSLGAGGRCLPIGPGASSAKGFS